MSGEMIRLMDLLTVVGEIYMLYGGLVLLVFGIFNGVKVVLRMMVLVLSWSMLLELDDFVSRYERLLLNGHWKIDLMGTMCVISMLFIFVIIVGEAVYTLRYKRMGYEIFILMYYGVIALILLLRCNDFLLLYLCLELYSLCMYVMVVIGRVSNFTVEAGLKYFVIGTVASGIFLLGLLVCYGFTGVLGYDDFEMLLGVEYGFQLVFGGFLMSVGVFVKLGIAPFHAWVLDVYEGSVTLVTMYLMLVPKFGLFLLLARLSMGVFYEMRVVLVPFLVVLAVISLLFGTIGGLFQDKLKRLMAYSSVANSGYLLILLVASGSYGVFYVYIYMSIYVIMVGSIMSVILSSRGYGGNRLIKLVSKVGLLLKSRYYVGLSMMIGILALAGFPPFIGFFGKMCVFLVVLDGYNYLMFGCVVVASVISAVYYLRVVRMLVFGKSKWGNLEPCSDFMGYVISIATHLMVLFPLYNSSFISLSMSVMGGL